MFCQVFLRSDEKVAGERNVLPDFFLLHFDVADSDRNAHDLLHLELHGGLDGVDLLLEGVVGADDGGKLTRAIKTRSQNPGDLLDEGLGGDERIVLLGKLNKLLVPVKLLEVRDTHAGVAELLGLLDVHIVTEHAHLHVGAGHGGKLEGAIEALVLPRIVVLKSNLKLNGLGKLALLARKGLAVLGDLLALGEGENAVNGLRKKVCVDLRHFVVVCGLLCKVRF